MKPQKSKAHVLLLGAIPDFLETPLQATEFTAILEP